jgi:nitrate reductase (NAD(P)H)
MPGLQEGGWMVRMRDEGVDTEDILHPNFGAPSSSSGKTTTKPPIAASANSILMINPEIKRRITMEELRAHNQEHEPWFAVHGEVYDGTAFLKGHPGGAESITLVAGEDATEDFMAIHSPVSCDKVLLG